MIKKSNITFQVMEKLASLAAGQPNDGSSFSNEIKRDVNNVAWSIKFEYFKRKLHSDIYEFSIDDQGNCVLFMFDIDGRLNDNKEMMYMHNQMQIYEIVKGLME